MSLLTFPTRLRRAPAVIHRDRLRRAAIAGVEALEDRQLMTAAPSYMPLTEQGVLVPTAQTVDLTATNWSNTNVGTLAPMENTLVAGSLPAFTPTGGGTTTYEDRFTVTLAAGETVDASINVQYNYSRLGMFLPTTANHASTVQVLGPNGSQIAYNAGNGPTGYTSGTLSNQAEVVFRAPTAGVYEIHVTSPVAESPEFNQNATGMTYTAAFRSISLDPTPDSQLDPNHNPADAAKLDFSGGGMYAWLSNSNELSARGTLASATNPTSDLTISGPTGRGFQINGNWTEVVASDGSVTYTASGKMSLETGVGAVPLSFPNGTSLIVTTAANGNNGAFGLVTTANVGLMGFSMDNIFKPLNNLGMSLNDSGISAPQISWGIGLGKAVSALTGAPTNYAVPYLYFAADTNVSAGFGNSSVSISKGALGAGLNVVVDPADPMIYLDIKDPNNGINDFAVAGSLNDLIPFYPTNSVGEDGASFFGDVYLTSDLDLSAMTDEEIPLEVIGGIVLNLDPNHQGISNAFKSIGSDIGNAFSSKATGAGWTKMLNDMGKIQFGVNGQVNISVSKGPFGLTEELGSASVVWNGLTDTIWFGGVYDGFTGVLGNMLSSDETYISGHVDLANGDFDFKLEGEYDFLGKQFADATFEVDNTGMDIDLDLGYDTGKLTAGSAWAEASFNIDLNIEIDWNGWVTVSGGADFDASAGIGSTSVSVDVGFTFSERFNIDALAVSLWDDFKNDVVDSIDNKVKSYFDLS
jgi:hypothetical protein